MGFEIEIEQFEGPLDLMLHLVRENKLNLFDLDMTMLCDQYLLYLNTMQHMKLEVASEYLSVLATLIEYKSKKMLPKEKMELEDEYEEDQRDKLVRRLIEYQKFKEVSEQFMVAYEERQKKMEKTMSKEALQWMQVDEQAPMSGNAYDLIKAMNRVIRRFEASQTLETKVTVYEMSVDERVLQLKARLQQLQGNVSFDVLCNDCIDLHMVIVTFLALLDLIKMEEVQYTVDASDRLWITRGVGV